MTTVDLIRIAKGIIPPVGATQAIARVDEQLKHRAAFLIDGRIRSDPVGPAFDKPRDAIRLVALLNGEAPRPGQHDLAVPGGTTSRDAAGQPEAPAPQVASTSRCAGCGGPLPPGRHGQRRVTCSAACRRAAARRAAAEAARVDTDGGAADVTPSRPSEAACEHHDWRIDYLNGPVGPVIGPLGAHRVLPICTDCGEPIPEFADPSSRDGADTLRRHREATDPTDLSNGPTGVPLSLGF